MPPVDKATNIEQLADAAQVLFDASVKTIHDVSVSSWKILAGETPPDQEVLAKNLTTLFGNAARDAGNLMMVWQQLAKIAAPAAPAAPPTPPPPPGQ
jgi:hypothetical protein